MDDNELLVRNWHNEILKECKTKLCRDLTDTEQRFITSRRGFLALEAIHDTVKSAEKDRLEAYLNSEAKQ
jgi:hypothetical protein